MKKTIAIIIIIVTIILLWFFATKHVLFRLPIDSLNNQDTELVDTISTTTKGVINSEVAVYTKPKSQQEDVGALTLFVNGINNIISTYGVILAFLTLLFGLLGYFNIKTVDNAYRVQEEEIGKKITELDILKDNFAGKMQSVEELEIRLKTQEKYVDKSTTQIYKVIYKMASLNPLQGKFLIENITNDMQLLRLFSSKKEERMAALYYFGEKGTKEHLDELREVAKNDLDEEIRQLAAKVIGRIEERERKTQPPINT